MKKRSLLLVALLGISGVVLQAQGARRPDAPDASADATFHCHVLPPRAGQVLNLTADQIAAIKAVEADAQAKLEKILTSAQLEQLAQMRPPRPPCGPDGAQGPGREDMPPPPPPAQ